MNSTVGPILAHKWVSALLTRPTNVIRVENSNITVTVHEQCMTVSVTVNLSPKRVPKKKHQTQTRWLFQLNPNVT